MSKIMLAIDSLHEIDIESLNRRSKTEITSVARLVTTLIFIVCTLSFERDNLTGVAGMLVFIVVTSIWEEISPIKGIKRFKVVFVILLLIGVSNYVVESLSGAGGSAVETATLLLKGALAVCGTYFLVIEIGMEGILGAMERLHVPNVLITVLMLNYRYIIVILKETEKMYEAYKLRAPGHRGIHISAWGSFAGLLMLRCMDRAKDVYGCMLLRGYQGSFLYRDDGAGRSVSKSIAYVFGWTIVFCFLRVVPIFDIAGSIVTMR